MLGVKEHNRYQHCDVVPAFVRAEHDCNMYRTDPELVLSIILPVTTASWTTRKLSEQKLRQLPGRRTASHLMFSRLVCTETSSLLNGTEIAWQKTELRRDSLPNCSSNRNGSPLVPKSVRMAYDQVYAASRVWEASPHLKLKAQALHAKHSA